MGFKMAFAMNWYLHRSLLTYPKSVDTMISHYNGSLNRDTSPDNSHLDTLAMELAMNMRGLPVGFKMAFMRYTIFEIATIKMAVVVPSNIVGYQGSLNRDTSPYDSHLGTLAMGTSYAPVMLTSGL